MTRDAEWLRATLLGPEVNTVQARVIARLADTCCGVVKIGTLPDGGIIVVCDHRSHEVRLSGVASMTIAPDPDESGARPGPSEPHPVPPTPVSRRDGPSAEVAPPAA